MKVPVDHGHCNWEFIIHVRANGYRMFHVLTERRERSEKKATASFNELLQTRTVDIERIPEEDKIKD